MRFAHINLVVTDPESSAAFYQQLILPDAQAIWLGDSLHLRNPHSDLAFQTGTPSAAPGAHHGFVAESARVVDHLVSQLKSMGIEITDDCTETGFRSVKFLDPDGYEVEVYWEQIWPGSQS